MTCPRCTGPLGDEPCLDHHPACPHGDCACPTVCNACCTVCDDPGAQRHEVPMPGGPATVTTSRPAPDTPWTTHIDAPGLDCHGWTRTTNDARMARRTHLLTVDLVRGHIERIPTIDFRSTT